jgi:hypothetical protein
VVDPCPQCHVEAQHVADHATEISRLREAWKADAAAHLQEIERGEVREAALRESVAYHCRRADTLTVERDAARARVAFLEEHAARIEAERIALHDANIKARAECERLSVRLRRAGIDASDGVASGERGR